MHKRFFIYTATLSVLALLIALISQHVFSLRPCAWCVFQRLILIGLILISVSGYLSTYYEAKIITFLARLLVIFTALGGAMAAWYQYAVASTVFSCELSLADRIMTQSGLESALPWLFGIYATCMEATVEILGLDYAVWALLFFLLIAISNLVVLLRK